MPPHRPRGQGRPQGASHIDLRYSADALKAISDLQLGSRPRAILKIRPPSNLEKVDFQRQINTFFKNVAG